MASALHDAVGRADLLPAIVSLPEAVAELQRWVDDDRQWFNARSGDWKSLLQDVQGSLKCYPKTVYSLADGDGWIDGTLRHGLAVLGNDAHRTEAAHREGLRRLVDRVEAAFTSSDVVRAAWLDVRYRENATERREAAKRLLALIWWAGRDPKATVSSLTGFLTGSTVITHALRNPRQTRRASRVAGRKCRRRARSLRVTRGQIRRRRTSRWDNGDGEFLQVWRRPTTDERMRLIDGLLRNLHDPAPMVVWLRFAHAQVGHSTIIEIGDAVRIYDGRWLRSALLRGHRYRMPDEASHRDRSLHSFCGVFEGQAPPAGDGPPDAFIRVEFAHANRATVVEQARRTAELAGAVGVLFGGSPTAWQLDLSYQMYRSGRSTGAHMRRFVPSGPLPDEHLASGRADTTSVVLRDMAGSLGAVFPVSTRETEEIAELLAWLRSVRTAAPIARLVLCDRAIETVSGWTGVGSPKRFVQHYLIPRWALGEIHDAVENFVFELQFNDPRRRLLPGDPFRLAWERVTTDQTIGFARGTRSVDYRKLLQSWPSLEALLVPGSRPHSAFVAASPLSDGSATAKWFDTLCSEGMLHEARRSRVRNALVHGGSVAHTTVERVLPFAEHMASTAAGRATMAKLKREDLTAFFVDDLEKVELSVRRLRSGTVPASVLFGSV